MLAITWNSFRVAKRFAVTLFTSSYTAASCAASPSCSSAYYLNWTRWACMSCAERARAVCPSSQNFIRGGGCGGVDTPFNTNNARYILG